MKYILIGFGPYARKVYYELMIKYNIEISLIIDLQSQEQSIYNFFSEKGCKIQNFYFVEDQYRDSLDLDIQTLTFLNTFIKQHTIDGIIISTEPKAHYAYLDRAVTTGLKIIVDKPILALANLGNDEKVNHQLLQQYYHIGRKIEKYQAEVMVFCQRRKHKGFLFIKQYIEEVIAQYGIPITYIGYYHSDGMWNMPNEFVYRENHPYKYGYGKLLHSGYHFIDICGYLTNLNNNHTKQINMYVSEINAKDTFAYANQYTFEKIFPNGTFHTNLDTYMNKIVNFGEVDCFINLQLLNQVGLVETTLQLDLLQTGFSRRAWQELPIDTYKGNGRLRHEYININLGHLVNIKVHSYKSFEKTNKAESTNFKYHYEVGASNHFEIQIFRNNQLIGGKSFEIIDLGKESENLMENARDSLFRDFVFYGDNASSYYAHEINMQLLNNMYGCLYNIRHNKIPFRKITLK